MKKIQKLLLAMALIPFGSAFGMNENKSTELAEKLKKENIERLEYVNGVNGGLNVINGGLLRFSQAISEGRKLNEKYNTLPAHLSMPFERSPHNKHVYIRLEYNKDGIIGDAALMNAIVDAGRTFESRFAKDGAIKLFHSESDKYGYLKLDRLDFEACDQDIQKIKKLVRDSLSDSEKETVEKLSEENEKLAKLYSQISKEKAELEHSVKNGNSNGNELQEEVKRLKQNIEFYKKTIDCGNEALEQKEGDIKALLRAEKTNSAHQQCQKDALAKSQQYQQVVNQLEEQIDSQKTLIEQMGNQPVGNEAATIQNLQSQLKAEKNSWRKYFVGGAVTLASYAGLQKAYNWYMNKA
ncbi:hypothetical protein HYX58_03945 [Candidatus Dependentiae bacterium]|nr:hypothetical protein [Candidatus Dependentiae bacterium]